MCAGHTWFLNISWVGNINQVKFVFTRNEVTLAALAYLNVNPTVKNNRKV